MSQLKRLLGVRWIALGPLAIWYLVQTAIAEIQAKPMIDTKIQWGVFVVVFIPIAIGLVIFGWYALQGEYDHLPSNSDEL